jgi:hypothetical protein
MGAFARFFKRHYRFLLIAVLAACIGGFLLSCGDSGSSSTSNTNTKHCSDEDYPLWCSDNKACCGKGYPVNCGGMCYKTREDAQRNCSARIDTCNRE